MHGFAKQRSTSLRLVYVPGPVAAPSSRTDRMSTSVLVQICRRQLGIDLDWHEMRGNLHLQCVHRRKRVTKLYPSPKSEHSRLGTGGGTEGSPRPSRSDGRAVAGRECGGEKYAEVPYCQFFGRGAIVSTAASAIYGVKTFAETGWFVKKSKSTDCLPPKGGATAVPPYKTKCSGICESSGRKRRSSARRVSRRGLMWE